MGAASAEQLRYVFLPGHHLVQRLGKVVCIRTMFCFGGFWHPFQVLEEGWCDVGTGRASSVLTSPSWPGLIWMLIKPACLTPETCSTRLWLDLGGTSVCKETGSSVRRVMAGG